MLKPDKKTLRVCGDFKLTVNKASKLDKYPIPKIEDLFALHIIGYVASVSTDRCRGVITRLCGDQHSLESVSLQASSFRGVINSRHISEGHGVHNEGYPGCHGIDILVTAATDEEHLASLDEALKRLMEAGRFRRDKCKFLAPSVEYLGYLIDAEGLHPTQEKVRAIQEVLEPNNVVELKS